MSATPATETSAPNEWRIRAQYVVDDEGNRVAVLLPIEDYERLMDDLDELYDVRAYDAAKAEGGEAIPWEQLKAELEDE